MPHALSYLEDGKRPSARPDPGELLPGEILVDEVPEGSVWDAATGALRQPTAAERLEAKKAAKIGELAGAAIDSLSPMFTPGSGRDETALLVAGHVLQICEALGIPPDPRLSTVVSAGEKALAKKVAVEGAASVEEVEAVGWT